MSSVFKVFQENNKISIIAGNTQKEAINKHLCFSPKIINVETFHVELINCEVDFHGKTIELDIEIYLDTNETGEVPDFHRKGTFEITADYSPSERGEKGEHGEPLSPDVDEELTVSIDYGVDSDDMDEIIECYLDAETDWLDIFNDQRGAY